MESFCGGDKSCILKFIIKQSSEKHGDVMLDFGYCTTTLELILEA